MAKKSENPKKPAQALTRKAMKSIKGGDKAAPKPATSDQFLKLDGIKGESASG